MSHWWMSNLYQSPGGGVLLFSWCFWVIGSITLHELAHGVAAIRNGDNTPRELGHMTLNPIVHMGIPALLMFAICGITWGAMPTDPARYRHRRLGEFTVALAGPATNLLLALLSGVACVFWLWLYKTGRLEVEDALFMNTTMFLQTGCILNLILAAFNMIPLPPLDGSRVLGAVVPAVERWFRNPEVQKYGMIALMLVLVTGVFQPVQAKMTAFGHKGIVNGVRLLQRMDGTPADAADLHDDDDTWEENGA